MRAVTRDGDLFGADWVLGGSAGKQSVIEIQAAVDQGEAALAEVTASIGGLTAALSGARSEAAARAQEADAALAALHDSDAQLSAVAEQLGRLGQATRSARPSSTGTPHGSARPSPPATGTARRRSSWRTGCRQRNPRTPPTRSTPPGGMRSR